VDIAPAGSLRRGRADIGDCDVLVATDDPIPVMEALSRCPALLRYSPKVIPRLLFYWWFAGGFKSSASGVVGRSLAVLHGL